MVKAYYDATSDTDFIKNNVGMLEQEFQYWMNNHMITINGREYALYGDKTSGPRPESYFEDIETSQSFETEEARQEHFAELKAGAESGMDFSSRWFIKNGGKDGTLIDIKCRSIVPVDLNAFLFHNAKLLSEFFLIAGDSVKSTQYAAKAQVIYEAVQELLYDEDEGVWFDYDLINKKLRNYYTPSNLIPLWAKCYNEAQSENIAQNVLKYIEKHELDHFPGGVPNTLDHTGEQWDFPNVWPPMQVSKKNFFVKKNVTLCM